MSHLLTSSLGHNPPPINTKLQTITTSLPEITPFIALQLRVARLEQEMSESKDCVTSPIFNREILWRCCPDPSRIKNLKKSVKGDYQNQKGTIKHDSERLKKTNWMMMKALQLIKPGKVRQREEDPNLQLLSTQPPSKDESP
ncbi:hypothetical protein Tco_0451031 [Tanacetum coccineum]